MDNPLLQSVRSDVAHTLQSVPPFLRSLNGASHLDVKSVRTKKSLNDFVPSLFSYKPVWLIALFAIRGVVAWILRLDEPLGGPRSHGDVFQVGARVAPFTVQATEADHYWIGTAEDGHLEADLVVVQDRERGEIHVATVVRYRDFRGPLYFNLIRPFHHLVVGGMARAAARV